MNVKLRREGKIRFFSGFVTWDSTDTDESSKLALTGSTAPFRDIIKKKRAEIDAMVERRYPSYVADFDWGIETLLNHFTTTDSREARYANLHRACLNHPQHAALSQAAPGPEAVGWRVSIFWPGEGAWFPGTVGAFDGERHRVDYDDGDVIPEDLGAMRYERLDQ